MRLRVVSSLIIFDSDSVVRCRFYSCVIYCLFFFKQKTAYEMRISDWSSDVCSSDLATGMGIDYSRAAKLRTKLNALADAAALSAVTRPMMDKSSTYAKQIATNTFSAQAASLSGAEVSKLIITVTDSANINIGRTATVRDTAKSNNIFADLLGIRALTIG